MVENKIWTHDIRSHLVVNYCCYDKFWLPVFVVDKSTARSNIYPELSSNIILKNKEFDSVLKQKLHQINFNGVLAKQQWYCKHIRVVLQIQCNNFILICWVFLEKNCLKSTKNIRFFLEFYSKAPIIVKIHS